MSTASGRPIKLVAFAALAVSGLLVVHGVLLWPISKALVIAQTGVVSALLLLWWRVGRRAASADARTTERYAEVFRRSKDAVVISTPEGRILDINQAGLELFGLASLDAARTIDLTRDVYVDPAQREVLRQRLLADRSVRDYPTTIRRGDEQVEIEGSTSTLEAPDGQILFLAILRDVSQRKREERELRHYRDDLEGLVRERTQRLEEVVSQLQGEIAERERAEDERRHIEGRMQRAQKLESLDLLAGGVAHDFNNLLVGILGNAGLAQLDLPAGSPAEPLLERIGIAARRAGELASQLLAYTGRGQFEFRTSNLARLVEEMTQLLEASVSKKAVIALDLTENLPPIKADPTQLRQVIMNLITNASDALGDQGGTISVRVGCTTATDVDSAEIFFPENLTAAQYVFLEVTDSGCGMDEETRKRIFDPFFTTKVHGRGLGMAAVLGIVRGHHGTVHLDSEPGVGSQFVVQVPALPRDHEAVALPPADRGRGAAWHGEGTVLVADDEPMVREVAAHCLRRLGFDVVQAPNGRVATDLLRREGDRIVAVIVDLNMPNFDGVETTRAMRAMRPDLPIVLSTGEGGPTVAHRAEGLEWSGRLKKPYTPAALEAVLRRALGGPASTPPGSEISG